MPLILSGNVASALPTGYDVANSCRFNDGDSPYMHITPSGDGNMKTFTISMWLKITTTQSASEGGGYIIMAGTDGETPRTAIALGSDTIDIQHYTGSAYTTRVTTNRIMRDPSAWWHLVVAFDTTQGTASNRVKIYVNGVQETSLSSTTYQDEDGLFFFNDASYKVFLGTYRNSSYFYDGYMAEVCLVDGSALSPTSFGEFDSDSPTIWKPIDVSGLTFGTNGFYLDFEASDNLGNDANGGTDLTEVNLAATDQSTDSPTNNFCTWNPLDNYYANSTFSEGNLKLVSGGSGDETYNTSTFGLTAGKWYVELKHEGGNNTLRQLFGVTQNPTDDDGQYLGGDNDDSWGYYDNDGKVYHNNSDSVASYDTWTTNDIIGLALDLDNNRLYFAKNGTWQGSSDPTDGTNAISIDANYTYFIAWGDASVGNMNSSVNFGSPPYANSSDAADENGYGAFEYAPPSGYLALCTKNLGSDGG